MQTTISKATLRRAKRRDRIARWVITLGGVTVIGSVVLILALIAGNALPLFLPCRSEEFVRMPLPASVPPDRVLAVGIESGVGEHGLVSYLLARDGTFSFFDLASGECLGRHPAGSTGPGPAKQVRGVERHGGTRFSLLWSDGSVSLVRVKMLPQFDAQGRRSVKYIIDTEADFPAESAVHPILAFARRCEDDVATCVRVLPGSKLSVVRQKKSENALGEKVAASRQTTILDEGLGPVTAVTLNRDGSVIYAGTESGQIARWQLDDEGGVAKKDLIAALDGRAVTAMALVFGDVSLAVGDDRGGLTIWSSVRSKEGPKLMRIHELRPQEGAVREIVPSAWNKSLLSIGADGVACLDYTTSERRLARLGGRGQTLLKIGQASRGASVIGLSAAHELIAWRVDAPHPEVSWKTLFGKVHYEGYDVPSYAWQTTGGDDFEPKFSIVPLLCGTLKGTLYAMLFAVPLALFGAVYTSQFATPGFKRFIKPGVEIMASLPSVVIGFLVALWFAPILESWILAVFAGMLTVPLVFLAFMVLWQAVRRFDALKWIEKGYEFILLVPVLLAGTGLAALLVGPAERLLFGGDFKLWLAEAVHTPYDPRNAIIVAFGLGFAVIPIIFSIADDALSTVPPTLAAGSMALGASRWQTLWRVVLPSASPGIFAAAMIGLGRAVGETMIVLMATGNTPILGLNPFNGFRALSANIAVEFIEAPVGGTLYRVLFLCAVLLFVLTFALNTAAELVRQGLRKRYGRF